MSGKKARWSGNKLIRDILRMQKGRPMIGRLFYFLPSLGMCLGLLR